VSTGVNTSLNWFVSITIPGKNNMCGGLTQGGVPTGLYVGL